VLIRMNAIASHGECNPPGPVPTARTASMAEREANLRDVPLSDHTCTAGPAWPGIRSVAPMFGSPIAFWCSAGRENVLDLVTVTKRGLGRVAR
jgi:hypothetical protein